MQTTICRLGLLFLVLISFPACSLVSEEGGGVHVGVTIDPLELVLNNYGKRTIFYEAWDGDVAVLIDRLPIDYRSLPHVPPGGSAHIGPDDIMGYKETTTHVAIWSTTPGKQWNAVRVFLPGELPRSAGGGRGLPRLA